MKPLRQIPFFHRAVMALALSAGLPERQMARRRMIYMTGPALLLIPGLDLGRLAAFAGEAARQSEHADLADFEGGVLVLDTEPETYPWQAPGSSTTLVVDPFGLASPQLKYADDLLVLKVVRVPGKLRIVPWTRLDERRFHGLVEFGQAPIQALRRLGWAEGDPDSDRPLPFDHPIGEDPPPAPPHHLPRPWSAELQAAARAFVGLAPTTQVAREGRPGWIEGADGWICAQLEDRPRPEAHRPR